MVSSSATNHQLQRDQTPPLFVNGVACETNAVNDVSESLHVHAVSIGPVAEHQVCTL